MSDLMTGSSGYATGQIDTATTQENESPVPIKGETAAAKINGMATAIVQMQGVMGVGPDLKGNKADLVERLAVAHHPNGTIKANTLTAFDGQLHSQLGGVPTGAVIPFAANTPPNGYLLCNGQDVLRSEYAALFTAIGITYGSGDGVATFNVPDLRGRVVIMVDGAANRITSISANGVNADILGGTGGQQVHTLTQAEMPAHTHPFNIYNTSGAGSQIVGNQPEMAQDGDLFDVIESVNVSTGGNGAHSNTQPWLALNYVIKT